MSANSPPVNRTIAPLKNVARFTELVERLQSRPPELPGFGVFYGRAGLGKSFSARYAINQFRAFYVECKFTWTQKAFCEEVLVELGLLPPRTVYPRPIYRAVAEIGEYLADNPGRPLIIDEADFLTKRRIIEIVRDIYKFCADAGASIILIGEENMPNALKMWERVDSRVLRAVKATPLDKGDVATLTGIICPGLSLAPALVEKLGKTAGGSARRIVTTLHDLKEKAGINGWTDVDLALWDPAGAD